jgi:hypothetical protein
LSVKLFSKQFKSIFLRFFYFVFPKLPSKSFDGSFFMQLVKILLFGFLSFSVANADELQGHRYDLPTSKFYLPFCHSKTVALQSGVIEKQRFLQPVRQHFFVQYEIQKADNQRWFVTCDLKNGQMTQNQNPNLYAFFTLDSLK